VRVPRTLPRILPPQEADRLVGALRTQRDPAMVLAMLLAGLRRCEVLGLRFEDVQVADRRLVVVEGKGGHHRVVPAANRFSGALGGYLHEERPGAAGTDRVFVVLKGPWRGLPLSAEGLDEILGGARRRAGLEHVTCHELRHSFLTRLQMGRIAFGASFGTSREHTLPAAQRAAVRCPACRDRDAAAIASRSAADAEPSRSVVRRTSVASVLIPVLQLKASLAASTGVVLTLDEVKYRCLPDSRTTGPSHTGCENDTNPLWEKSPRFPAIVAIASP